MADARSYIVSFEGVSATVGGVDIAALVELHLNFTANSIPTVTLLVDVGAVNENASAVDGVSLAEAGGFLQGLRGMVKSSSGTLELSVTAVSTGPGGSDTQTLKLSGWMLTDVAFSPVVRGGVCTASLTFMHPICKANFGGEMPALLSTNPVFNDGGSNPLDVFISALKTYADTARVADVRDTPNVPDGSAGPLEIREALLSQMDKAVSALAAHTAWSGGGLPLFTALAAYEPQVIQALSRYAAPTGGTSVFQRFSRALVPECSLVMGGDFTSSALSVHPLCPWASPTSSVGEGDIVSIALPQRDPSPISGVHMLSNDTSEELEDSYHQDGAQIKKLPSEIFYVPQSEIGAEYMYGPIVQLQEPGWLYDTHCLVVAASRTPPKQPATPTSTPISDDTASINAMGESQVAIDYASALMACSKAYYETSLMSGWVFEVTCRLMLSANIRPGEVMAVKAAGSTVLCGYVNSITHSISIRGRSATTVVTCSHPQIMGKRPESITSGDNAMYQ